MFAHYNQSRLQSPSNYAPMATGGYNTGYSHPGNPSLSQHNPDNVFLSRTSEKHTSNASSVMSQQYKNMDRHMTSPHCLSQSAQHATSSLLTTQRKDALSMVPKSNYGISQSSIYSWPDHSFSAITKNSFDRNLY